MYVLILFAVLMTPDGPMSVTRPAVEYYKTESDCKKLGVKYIEQFTAAFESPLLLAAKCVEVKDVEGDPA